MVGVALPAHSKLGTVGQAGDDAGGGYAAGEDIQSNMLTLELPLWDVGECNEHQHEHIVVVVGAAVAVDQIVVAIYTQNPAPVVASEPEHLDQK